MTTASAMGERTIVDPSSVVSPAPAPRVAARTWSIRWIVTSAMVLLTTGAVIGVGTVSERDLRSTLETALKSQLLLEARNLATVGSNALLSNVPEWTLLPLIKELRDRERMLALVVVVDRNGIIQGDSDVRRLGSRFTPPPGLEVEAGSPSSPTETLLGSGRLLVARTFILQPEGPRLGTVWVGLERAAIERRIQEARRQRLLVLFLFLLLGTGTALLVSSLLLRPLIPLRAGLERIGRGDLATRIEIRDRTEFGVLAETVNHMADELRGAQSELLERERIAHEVHLARRIQRSLLPSSSLVAEGFVVEGSQRAAAEVGGDYYQTVRLEDGRVAIVVADVSGKGLAGSLVTAMLHALLRPSALAQASPGAFLAHLDRQLGEMLEPGTFVTLFHGLLDPTTGVLIFASAGHNPALVLRADGGIEWVKARGAPLGALRGSRIERRYEEVRVTLAAGDALIQYTDGIHEAFAPDGQSSFGLERTAEAARAGAAGGASAILGALSSAVDRWRDGAPQHDDETLLVVSRELESKNSARDRDTKPKALGLLAEARSRGRRLTLPASLAVLVRIPAWIDGVPELRSLVGRPRTLLLAAVHEACANVVEHACGNDPALSFDLWWLPDAPESEAARAGEPGSGAGWFVLRDRGTPFNYQEWSPPELEDPRVRGRGRGFGLEIVRRVMKSVATEAGTSEGNLFWMRFEPMSTPQREEAHVHDR